MNENNSKRGPVIEGWLAGSLLSAPAFVAWGLVCLYRVRWPSAGSAASEAARAAFLLPLCSAISAAACVLASVAYLIWRALRRRRIDAVFAFACLAAGIGMFAATLLGKFLWYDFGVLPTLVALGTACLPVGYALAFLASRSLRGKYSFSWKECALPASIAGLWLLFGSLAFTGIGSRFLNGSWVNFIIGFLLASFLVLAFCVARVAFFLAAGGSEKEEAAYAEGAGPEMRPTTPRSRAQRRLASRIVFCFLLPFIGIGVAFALSRGNDSIAGFLEFLATPWVIGLAALSGASLCLPEPRRLRLRFALACLRAACLSFSAYVFIVFLPFMPAIPFTLFLCGAGILLAVPLANFLCHLAALRADVAALKAGFKPAVIPIAFCLSFLIIPLFIAGQAVWDRANLKAAVAWVGSDEPEKSRFSGDRWSVRRALDAQDATAGGNRPTAKFPLIDEFRRAIVIGARKLNARTASMIETGFALAPGGFRIAPEKSLATSEDFTVSATCLSSVFDPEYGLERSRIELRPRSTGQARLAEFRLSFELPKAAWLQNFYLYVGDKKRAGRIFDRAAASAVYESILRRARDPGLLSISEGNLASLRVFPFAKGEERRTGFDILHSGAFRLELGGASLELPGIPPDRAEKKAAWIIEAAELSRLPPLLRRPYIHVIAEASASSLGDKEALLRRVRLALETPLPASTIEALPARISFVDFEERARTDSRDMEKALATLSGRGGFLPYRAIQSIALESAKERPYAFPVFIIVRAGAPLEWAPGHPEPFSAALALLCPETDGAYAMDGNGNMAAIEEGGTSATSAIRPFHPVARLLRVGAESIVRIEDGAFRIDPKAKDPFQLLVAAREKAAFSLGRKAARSLELHRLSKESGILCPATSSIVLESDDQYLGLEKNENDTHEDEGALTEMGLPSSAIAILLVGASIAVLLARESSRRRRLSAVGPRANLP